MFRECSISGCDKPSRAKGFCRAHYARWRMHGDPLGGRTPEGEPSRFYRDVVLPYGGEDCLIWPYERSHDGYARTNGQYVSRRLCEDVNGPPPTPKHDAAHSCGAGRHGCVTKGHLAWKTRKANLADKVVHGTHNRGEKHVGAKLTEDDVRQIKELAGTIPQRDIGRKFGVSQSAVSLILVNKNWSHLGAADV